MTNQMVISGEQISLKPITAAEKRRLWTEVQLLFTISHFHFHGQEYLVAKSRSELNLRPMEYARIAKRVQEIMGIPLVFLFSSLNFTQRNRLIAQGVYFIVSGLYLSLPSILLATKVTDKQTASVLSAPAQYLLLYHLQVRSLERMTAKEMAEFLPYKYVTITVAMQVLSDLSLCQIETDKQNFKHIHFDSSGHTLYKHVQQMLQSPIRIKFYCDDLPVDNMNISGINALSAYSMLNPTRQQAIAIEDSTYRAFNKQHKFVGRNNIEGKYQVEVWRYPIIPVKNGYVDPISLSLTLQDENDPRVESEIENMIAKLW